MTYFRDSSLRSSPLGYARDSSPSSPAADVPAALRGAFLDVRRARRRELARAASTVLACALFAVAALASFHAFDRYVIDSIWAMADELAPPPLTRVLAVAAFTGAVVAFIARVRLGAKHNVALALCAVAIAGSTFLLFVVPFQINVHLQYMVDVNDQIDEVYGRAPMPCSLDYWPEVLLANVGARTIPGVASLIVVFAALATRRFRIQLLAAAVLVAVGGAAVFAYAAYGAAAAGVFCPIF